MLLKLSSRSVVMWFWTWALIYAPKMISCFWMEPNERRFTKLDQSRIMSETTWERRRGQKRNRNDLICEMRREWKNKANIRLSSSAVALNAIESVFLSNFAGFRLPPIDSNRMQIESILHANSSLGALKRHSTLAFFPWNLSLYFCSISISRPAIGMRQMVSATCDLEKRKNHRKTRWTWHQC